MSKRLACLFVLCAIILFCGCERRPLVDYSNSVTLKVKVRTDNIPNVTPGTKYNEALPSPEIETSMFYVLFYDADTKQAVSQGFISDISIDKGGNMIVSGSVRVKPGTYDIICYNFDTRSTMIKNERDWNSITAYTSEIDEYLYSRFQSRADGEAQNESSIYYEPDHLMVGRKYACIVIESVKSTEIEMEANSIIDTYYIQIGLVNGQYAANATAVLSGLSKENLIGPNLRDEVPSEIFFEMQRGVDTRLRSVNQNILYAVFSTFGKIPEADSELYVTFNVVTTRGDIQEKSFNMNDVFKTEDAVKRHWLIINDEFVIKPPINDGGGFKPTVDDWQSVSSEIEIKP